MIPISADYSHSYWNCSTTGVVSTTSGTLFRMSVNSRNRDQAKPAGPNGQASASARDTQRQRLGQALRRARQKLDWTLRELSAHAGVSVSLISQIERGTADPSLETLRDLADALGTTPFLLLAGPPSRSRLVRAGSGTRLALPSADVEFELMTPSLDRSFEVARFSLQPGGRSIQEARGHPGEEAVIVLSGSARFEIGEEAHILNAGDLLMWDARIPHRAVALSSEPVTGYMVICPPTF
jgi:transcriptional regulator with XRE-family HTH domain